jgi:ferric-dicitrate binding protein FerR (iron transport regulator)
MVYNELSNEAVRNVTTMERRPRLPRIHDSRGKHGEMVSTLAADRLRCMAEIRRIEDQLRSGAASRLYRAIERCPAPVRMRLTAWAAACALACAAACAVIWWAR